jgi:hypothetical protein
MGRPLAEEVRHAIERHLTQPPRLVTPELDEAAVTAGAGRQRGRRAQG